MTRQLAICVFVLLTGKVFSQSSILIQDAVDKKAITYRLYGSWNLLDKKQFLDADGQYFGKCMTIEMKNRTDSTFWIHVANGLMLMSEDTSTQDMVVTKPIYVKLVPKESKSLELYAMCSEIHDAIPHQQIEYKIGSMADEHLVSITAAINDMFMHNIVGQGAVWAYTDNATEEDIRKYGATDASIEMTIQILNKASVTTPLNPTSQSSSDMDTTVVQLVTVPTSIPDENDVVLDVYVFYTGVGISLILVGSTLYLLIRKGKSNRDEV